MLVAGLHCPSVAGWSESGEPTVWTQAATQSVGRPAGSRERHLAKAKASDMALDFNFYLTGGKISESESEKLQFGSPVGVPRS